MAARGHARLVERSSGCGRPGAEHPRRRSIPSRRSPSSTAAGAWPSWPTPSDRRGGAAGEGAPVPGLLHRPPHRRRPRRHRGALQLRQDHLQGRPRSREIEDEVRRAYGRRVRFLSAAATTTRPQEGRKVVASWRARPDGRGVRGGLPPAARSITGDRSHDRPRHADRRAIAKPGLLHPPKQTGEGGPGGLPLSREYGFAASTRAAPTGRRSWPKAAGPASRWARHRVPLRQPDPATKAFETRRPSAGLHGGDLVLNSGH